MSVITPVVSTDANPPRAGESPISPRVHPVGEHSGLHPRGEHLPVPLAALRLADRYPFDLYTRDLVDGRPRFVLFRSPAPMNVRLEQLTPGSAEVATRRLGRMLDLSSSGVRVFSPVALPAGTGVRLIPPDGLRLRRDLIAEAVRSQADPVSGGYVAGLCFRMSPPPSRPLETVPAPTS